VFELEGRARGRFPLVLQQVALDSGKMGSKWAWFGPNYLLNEMLVLISVRNQMYCSRLTALWRYINFVLLLLLLLIARRVNLYLNCCELKGPATTYSIAPSIPPINTYIHIKDLYGAHKSSCL